MRKWLCVDLNVISLALLVLYLKKRKKENVTPYNAYILVIGVMFYSI